MGLESGQLGAYKAVYSFAMRILAVAGLTMYSLCASEASTLKIIRDKGFVTCGVTLQEADDSYQAGLSGFDKDYCRAISAAIFGDPNKTKFIELSSNDRFEALKSKRIDVLLAGTTWTMSREVDNNFIFVATVYYDGQGFLVPRKLNYVSALQIKNQKVCVLEGTTNEINMKNFSSNNQLAIDLIKAPSETSIIDYYKNSNCNVITGDITQLNLIRTRMARPEDHSILNDVISREPLSMVVRQDDPQWANITKWIHFALLNAEYLDISSINIEKTQNSSRNTIRNFIGLDADFGSKLGLSRTWARNIVSSVGNYGEIIDRNLGQNSILNVPRGLNQLWNFGGIQYAPPIQ